MTQLTFYKYVVWSILVNHIEVANMLYLIHLNGSNGMQGLNRK